MLFCKSFYLHKIIYFQPHFLLWYLLQLNCIGLSSANTNAIFLSTPFSIASLFLLQMLSKCVLQQYAGGNRKREDIYLCYFAMSFLRIFTFACLHKPHEVWGITITSSEVYDCSHRCYRSSLSFVWYLIKFIKLTSVERGIPCHYHYCILKRWDQWRHFEYKRNKEILIYLEVIYYFTYFSTVVSFNSCVFLSCRPFVINTFSTGVVGFKVNSVSWLGQLTESYIY